MKQTPRLENAMNAKIKTLTAGAICIAMLATLIIVSVGQAEPSAAPKPAPTTGLQVFPPDINLETSRDTQSIVAKFTEPGGITRDVTSQCKFELANPALAKIEAGVAHPLADGTTELTVTYKGETRKLP